MTNVDKEALMEILRHTPEFKPGEVMVAEELMDSYLRDSYRSGYYVFVAESDSAIRSRSSQDLRNFRDEKPLDIVGYICYGPTPLTEGTWDMYWMAVSPKKKRLGVGSSLMTFAEDKIREAGGRLILIETSSSPEYQGTIKFHSRQGYQVVSRIPDFYAQGDDKLIFQKRVNKEKK